MASGPGTLSSLQRQEPLKPSSAACTLPRPAPSLLLPALTLPQTCLPAVWILPPAAPRGHPSLPPHPCTQASATEPRGCWSRPLRSEAPCQGDPAAAWTPPSQGPGRLVWSQMRHVVKFEGKRRDQVLSRPGKLPEGAEPKIRDRLRDRRQAGETGLSCRCWRQPGGHSDQPDLHTPAPVGHARGPAPLDEEMLAQPLLHVLQLRWVRGLPGTMWSFLSRMASLESVLPGPTPSTGEAPAPQAWHPGPGVGHLPALSDLPPMRRRALNTSAGTSAPRGGGRPLGSPRDLVTSNSTSGGQGIARGFWGEVSRVALSFQWIFLSFYTTCR